MTATLPGMTTLIGVAMRRGRCEVSEVSSLTSQRPQLPLTLISQQFHSSDCAVETVCGLNL